MTTRRFKDFLRNGTRAAPAVEILTKADVESELQSIRDDLEHLRNWKRKIESQVHAVESEQRQMEERLDRLEALKELRLAGGQRSDGAGKDEE